MAKLADLKQERGVLKRSLAEVDNQIDDLKAKTVIVCECNVFGKGCGKKFFIKNLQYIQTHWYEKPYGCTGGDTWHAGEGRFICPCCNHINGLYDRKEFESMKHLFESVTDEYKD